jgi:hypothetical protein
VSSLNLSLKQEIPGFTADSKAQIYFMIDNLANLLNSDWGIERRLKYSRQSIYSFGGLDEQGRYKINKSYEGADLRNYDMISSGSAWKIKAGIRYEF